MSNAVQAREAARHNDGKFGTQPLNAGDDVDLAVSEQFDAATHRLKRAQVGDTIWLSATHPHDSAWGAPLSNKAYDVNDYGPTGEWEVLAINEDGTYKVGRPGTSAPEWDDIDNEQILAPRTFTDDELDEATAQAVDSLLWSSTVQDGDEENAAAEDYEFAQDLEDRVRGDVEKWFKQNSAAIARAQEIAPSYGLGEVAHDYILTRNGHGAGFWDRGLGKVGDHLTERTRGSWGSREAVGHLGELGVELGDDGLLHAA